jgi:23S rRNA (uracil1939-C5)-methyltransferase
MVHVITAPEAANQTMANALGEMLMAEQPDVASFVHSTRKARSAVAEAERLQAVMGEPWLEERIGDVRYRIPVGGFFQTNTLAAALLYDEAVAMAGLGGDERVLDLYCGCGGLALHMAPHLTARGAGVTGVEVVAEAVEAAAKNAELNGMDNIVFRKADLASPAVLADLPGADVVVLDPPRQGLGEEGARALAAKAPGRIVYVSCDPATLARDAKVLAETYTPQRLRAFDLFPHTAHIEAVALFVRK